AGAWGTAGAAGRAEAVDGYPGAGARSERRIVDSATPLGRLDASAAVAAPAVSAAGAAGAVSSATLLGGNGLRGGTGKAFDSAAGAGAGSSAGGTSAGESATVAPAGDWGTAPALAGPADRGASRAGA